MLDCKVSVLQKRAQRGTPPSPEPVRLGWTGFAVKNTPNEQRPNRL